MDSLFFSFVYFTLDDVYKVKAVFCNGPRQDNTTIYKPRTIQEQWYHFWPDRPTGTLRVDFTKFRQNLLCFCSRSITPCFDFPTCQRLVYFDHQTFFSLINVCLSAQLWQLRTLHSPPPLNIWESVPQVLKQVVNLSCYSTSDLFILSTKHV